MKKQIICVILAFFLLLGGCRAAFPATTPPGTTPPGTTPPGTTVPTTVPLDIPPTTALTAQIEVWHEGELSRIPVQIVSGQCGSYTIAMDPAYFTFLPQEGSDLFLYEDWGSEQPVYYRITPWNSPYDPDVFATRLEAAAYTSPEVSTLTLAGRPATVFTMYGTGENSGYCLHYYLIDCGSSCYTVEARFSLEMYEGLFAIMCACFETFSQQ